MSDGTSKNILPHIIDPRRFCQQGVVLRGSVVVDGLPRLTENNVVVDHMSADLAFSVDEQRTRVVQGSLAAGVQVQCQRCLEAMPLAIDCKISLAVVWDEESSRKLADVYDPWIVTSEEADLYAMLEEEVLLNLPFVTYHNFACGQLPAEHDIEKDKQSEKANPFQMLQQLKGKMKQ
jgi:uncharacterized protein